MNRWVRLWVFVSIIYFLGVLSVLWMVYPRTDWLYQARYEEIFLLASKFSSKYQNPTDFKASHSNLNYKELSYFLEQEMLSHPENFTACMKDPKNPFCDLIPSPNIKSRIFYWDNRIILIEKEQKRILYYAVIIWLIPVIFLYFLGLLLKWVISGFRNK